MEIQFVVFNATFYIVRNWFFAAVAELSTLFRVVMFSSDVVPPCRESLPQSWVQTLHSPTARTYLCVCSKPSTAVQLIDWTVFRWLELRGASITRQF